jgi:acyl-CoA thioesterase I
MKAMNALLFLTCVAMAGCSKSEREADVRPADPPARSDAAEKSSVSDHRPTLVVLGDSLAEGFGVAQGQAFPEQLQSKLDRNGYSYHVVNLGVSGDTTTGGLGRTDYVVSLRPAIVILELGGNDGLRGIPVASTKKNLEDMIQKLKGAGSEVLLAGMTLPPNYGESYIRSFEKAYKDLANKYSLRFIPFLMQDIRTQMEATPNLMQRDGIHPTAVGHSIIAETVFRFLKPMLKKS